MPLTISAMECGDSDVWRFEAKWREQGYRFVDKKHERELLPMEYLKRFHKGSINSFDGPLTWTLVRREQ